MAVDQPADLGVEPVVTVDPAFAPLVAAARERKLVSFDYRVPERDAPTTRRLQPWGVVCWRARWYVVGHDLDRQATRCFRLSRITSPVTATSAAGAFPAPVNVDLLSHVARWGEPQEHRGQATLLVRPGRADGVRRRAERTLPGPDGDQVTLPFRDPDRCAEWLVRYGADVRVLDPPEVRDAVISRLKEIVAAAPIP